jgi:hypothetical protein
VRKNAAVRHASRGAANMKRKLSGTFWMRLLNFTSQSDSRYNTNRFECGIASKISSRPGVDLYRDLPVADLLDAGLLDAGLPLDEGLLDYRLVNSPLPYVGSTRWRV